MHAKGGSGLLNVQHLNAGLRTAGDHVLNGAVIGVVAQDLTRHAEMRRVADLSVARRRPGQRDRLHAGHAGPGPSAGGVKDGWPHQGDRDRDARNQAAVSVGGGDASHLPRPHRVLTLRPTRGEALRRRHPRLGGVGLRQGVGRGELGRNLGDDARSLRGDVIVRVSQDRQCGSGVGSVHRLVLGQEPVHLGGSDLERGRGVSSLDLLGQLSGVRHLCVGLDRHRPELDAPVEHTRRHGVRVGSEPVIGAGGIIEGVALAGVWRDLGDRGLRWGAQPQVLAERQGAHARHGTGHERDRRDESTGTPQPVRSR